jgi:hypothetical protein
MTDASPIGPDTADPGTASTAHKLTEALLRVVSSVPQSLEKLTDHPDIRAKAIISVACKKAGATSGALALPPGPLGYLTLIPDLYAIWKIQAGMVADLAALHGKSAALTRETMIYCLFRHAASQLVRDLAARAGERIVVRTLSPRILERLLGRLGYKLTQRLAAGAAARLLPLLGAAAVGAYAYYDTAQVGKTAMALFSSPIEITPEAPAPGDPRAPADPPAST